MKNFKKFGVMLGILSLGLSSLTACSSGDNTAPAKEEVPVASNESKEEKTEEKKEEEKATTEEEVTIRYWQHSSAARDEVMTKLADDFMKENPNIKVELEFIPEDSYTQKLIPALASGTAPDVFQLQSGMINRLAKQGSIQPLDESIISGEELDKVFVPSTIEALKVDGKYYGLPTDVQTVITFWNKTLVQEAGLDAEKGPQTWEEMREWAIKLTKTENGMMTQSGWGHKGYFPEVQAVVEQNGGKFVDDTGKFVFADDPKSVEAITFLTDLYRKDKVYNMDFMKNWAGFRQGKVAMMIGHPAMIGNLKTTAPDIDYAVGLLPTMGGESTTVVTSWGYVMSNNAKADAATKFILYLTSEEVQRMWTETTGELPSRANLLEDATLASDPKVAVALESLKTSIVGNLQMGQLSSIWQTGYESIILTDRPVQEVLTETQNLLNEEIAKDIK